MTLKSKYNETDINKAYTYFTQKRISQEDVYRGTKQKEVSDLVYDICSTANQHLQTDSEYDLM